MTNTLAPSTEVGCIPLLLVSSSQRRFNDTQHAVDIWSQPALLNWVSGHDESLRRARALQVALVVIDANDGLAESRTLARLLLQHLAHLEVLIFTDADRSPASQPALGGVWPWAAMPQVLTEWLDLRRQLNAGTATIRRE
jgi:hypothetical protein